MADFTFSEEQIEIARKWIKTNLAIDEENLALAKKIGSPESVSRCKQYVTAWQDYGKRLEYEWFEGPHQYVTWIPHLSDLLLAAEGFPEDDGTLVNYNKQGRPRLRKLRKYTGLKLSNREWWQLWPGLYKVEPLKKESVKKESVEKEPVKEKPVKDNHSINLKGVYNG